MQFDVLPLRVKGVTAVRHFSGSHIRGEFVLEQVRDVELNRTVKQATLRTAAGEVLMGPLLDADVISARPNRWTVTGWERLTDILPDKHVACQQSWLMIPADFADEETAYNLEVRKHSEAQHRRQLEQEGGLEHVIGLG
nr:hypothetical protein [uncultured Roseateles sp.]